MPTQARYAVTPLETLRHFGAHKALLLVALKALRIRPVVFMSRAPKPSAATESASHGIRRATPDDAHLFEAAGFPHNMLEAKLAEGLGWIRVVDDELIGWNFYGMQQSLIDDWLVLRSSGDPAVWSLGTWVRHDLRGAGALGRFAALGGEWCLENGYDEVLSWIDLTNYASRRATVKLGSREIGRATVLFRLFGVALVHDGRRWHLGRWTASRPLVLQMERIRRDRSRHSVGQSTAPPQSSALPGAK